MSSRADLDRGRQIRLGLMILRCGGMCVKQAAGVLGIGIKAAEYHCRRLKQMNEIQLGSVTDMALAVKFTKKGFRV